MDRGDRVRMRVEVQLFGWLCAYQPGAAGKAAPVELPGGATVADLLCRLGVSGRTQEASAARPSPDVPSSPDLTGSSLLVLVNGLQARGDTSLKPGDRVSIFPPLGG
ncbi:MAG: MoaD/ThiS family protein [Bacillota bacterium]